ncbi:MAG: hypothetical protein V1709_03710 [Planctomycetota bacterium]
MWKNVFIVVILAGLLISLSLVVISKINIKATETELQETKNRLIKLESENKNLSARLADNDKELSAFKIKMAGFPKQSVEVIQPPSEKRNPIDTKSKSQEFLEALTKSGQSTDERALKLQKLGKLMVKMSKAQKAQGGKPSKEEMQMMSEVMRSMSELMTDPIIMEFASIDQSGNEFELVANPAMREILSNFIIGVFEGLEQPLSKSQVEEYKNGLARLAGINVDDKNKTKIENAIQYLQNAGTIESEMKRLESIFSPEQKEAMNKMKEGSKNVNIDIIPEISQPYTINNNPVSNTGIAVETVLSDWANATPELKEQNDTLKPLAEQYLRDYTDLRKKSEMMYDKNIMDLYFERNAPADRNTQWYNDRAKTFATDSSYKNAKTALDLEFLQLKNQYDKEVTKIIGSEKSDKFNNRPICINHFPNIE